MKRRFLTRWQVFRNEDMKSAKREPVEISFCPTHAQHVQQDSFLKNYTTEKSTVMLLAKAQPCIGCGSMSHPY